MTVTVLSSAGVEISGGDVSSKSDILSSCGTALRPIMVSAPLMDIPSR